MNLIMHFWSVCFYLLYIFGSVVVESSELEFHAKIWGNKGFVISWDPTKVTNASQKYFTFIGKRRLFNLLVDTGKATSGQYHLQYPFKDDELYEITIQECNGDSEDSQTLYSSDGETWSWSDKLKCIPLQNYTLKGEINLKNLSSPEKPSFKWEIICEYGKCKIRISWIPCGEDRNCHGKEPGTHYAVKYKLLDLPETIKFVHYNEKDVEIENIYLGKIYEITVSSIYGNFSTDSDPQKVFQAPGSGPVHSVRVLPMDNRAIYISWRQPRQIPGNTLQYVTSLGYDDNCCSSELTWKHGSRLYMVPNSGTDIMSFAFTNMNEMSTEDLPDNSRLNFMIIPFGRNWTGLDYRFNHTIHPVNSSLPLAKPDFVFSMFEENSTTCELKAMWIPCAEVFDCKNMSPGDGFILTVKNDNDERNYTRWHDDNEYIHLNQNQTYTVIGASKIYDTSSETFIYRKFSESVIKTITCEKH